jgi:hypothetical protein
MPPDQEKCKFVSSSAKRQPQSAEARFTKSSECHIHYLKVYSIQSITVSINTDSQEAVEVNAGDENIQELGNEGSFSVEEIRCKYPKAYTKWTEEEESLLITEHAKGKSIDELAERFQRQPSAIRSRLGKLGSL